MIDVDVLDEGTVDAALAAAARRLLVVERRFGLERDVGGGLHRMLLFRSPLDALVVDLKVAAWAARKVGAPLHQLADFGPWTWSPCSFGAVRAHLLDDENFGAPCADDTACFDATPEGDAGIVERDDALRAFLGLLGPTDACALAVIADRRVVMLPLGVSIITAPRLVVVFSNVGDVGLDTGSWRDVIF